MALQVDEESLNAVRLYMTAVPAGSAAAAAAAAAAATSPQCWFENGFHALWKSDVQLINIRPTTVSLTNVLTSAVGRVHVHTSPSAQPASHPPTNARHTWHCSSTKRTGIARAAPSPLPAA